LQIQLSAPLSPGWVCLRVPEPADGLFRLASVHRSDGVADEVAIDWPASGSGCLLEGAEDFPVATGQLSPLQPRFEDGRYRMQLAPGGRQKFYRLMQ
jgi:hypothetical protein